MVKIKKIIVNLLTTRLAYSILKLIRGSVITLNGVHYNLSVLELDYYTKCLLYLGLYEKSEIGLINTVMPKNSPIIEIGSSIGITTCQIASQTQGQVYSIEANPKLINKIRTNLELNSLNNVSVSNLALSASEQVYFTEGDLNTTGTISSNSSENSIAIKGMTLKQMSDSFELVKFFLIADIEGAECHFLLENTDGLEKCSGMILELHELVFKEKKYSVEDLKSIIITLGFKILIDEGPVIYCLKE